MIQEPDTKKLIKFESILEENAEIVINCYYLHDKIPKNHRFHTRQAKIYFPEEDKEERKSNTRKRWGLRSDQKLHSLDIDLNTSCLRVTTSRCRDDLSSKYEQIINVQDSDSTIVTIIDKILYSYNIDKNTYSVIKLPLQKFSWINEATRLKHYKDNIYAINYKETLKLFNIIVKGNCAPVAKFVGFIPYKTQQNSKILVMDYFFFRDDYIILLDNTCQLCVFNLKSKKYVLSVESIHKHKERYDYLTPSLLASKNEQNCQIFIPSNSSSEIGPNRVLLSLVRISFQEEGEEAEPLLSFDIVDCYVVSPNHQHTEMKSCVLEIEVASNNQQYLVDRGEINKNKLKVFCLLTSSDQFLRFYSVINNEIKEVYKKVNLRAYGKSIEMITSHNGSLYAVVENDYHLLKIDFVGI